MQSHHKLMCLNVVIAIVIRGMLHTFACIHPITKILLSTNYYSEPAYSSEEFACDTDQLRMALICFV